MRVISWNLLHGRDAPPDPALGSWRSRLLRSTEANATHVQVNRPLLEEFGLVLARDPWQLALLQEAPPGWLRPLCLRCGAHGASALTARNWGAGARSWLAERNPDLMASAEGGSNQLLVRPPWRIERVARATLTRRPERRRMLWARLRGPAGAGATVCVAVLHATAADEEAAAGDVELAAERASRWAGQDPLVLAGDLNLRPRTAGAAFQRLADRFGLTGPTGPAAVDHVLVRGIPAGAARSLPPEWRELSEDRASGRRRGLRLRLSDHAPVARQLAPWARRRSSGGVTSRPLAR